MKKLLSPHKDKNNINCDHNDKNVVAHNEVNATSYTSNYEIFSKENGLTTSSWLTSSNVISKKLPPAVKQWLNSIYSFNKNYTKAMPAVDTIVTKMIRSFFSINPLQNNPGGKKSRLIQRRFKRLSLNRIFVSRPEIKHSNDKVFITVYLFNKKKKSLLYKLKHLYDTILFNPTSNNESLLSSRSMSMGKKRSLLLRKKYKLSKKAATLYKKHKRIIGKSNSLYRYTKNTISITSYNKNRVLSAKKLYSGVASLHKVNGLKRNMVTSNEVNYVTANKIKKYCVFLSPNHINLSSHNKESILRVKPGKITITMQKVKALHKLFILRTKLNFFSWKLHVDNNATVDKTNSNDSIYNRAYHSIFMYSSKILVNTSKLLRKPLLQVYKEKNAKNQDVKVKRINSKKGLVHISSNVNKPSLMLNGPTFSLVSKKQKDGIARVKPLSTFLSLYNENKLKKYKARSLWLRKLNAKARGRKLSRADISYLKRAMKNLLFIKKINKINRFFKKYKNVLLTRSNAVQNITKDSTVTNNDLKNTTLFSENNIATMYKLNYIKELLDKELLYVYYIKMLSFNNSLFKNGFLNPLNNILCKIYNKKVILNLVNLKYIHLNSDIFTQAITVRLRNFKKNRLNKVLRKALKLVVLSKINIYSYDIHSPVNEYVEQYYNKFKLLNMDIFRNNSLSTQEDINASNYDLYANSMYKIRKGTMSRKGLSVVQSNTVNFIRHKSVFGVRLEAAGRLTKRSTASRAIFKIRYKGSLRNNTILNRSDSSTVVKANAISNLQFTKISSKTRNGSFGLKGWLNNN